MPPAAAAAAPPKPPSRVHLVLAGASSRSLARYTTRSSPARRAAHASHTRGAALGEELSFTPSPLGAGEADEGALHRTADGSDAQPSVRTIGRRLKALHTLHELSAFVSAEAGSFHAGNVSHALSLLAHSSRSSTLSSSSMHAATLPAFRRLVEELPRVISDFEPQDAALSVWAMSVLGYLDRSAFNVLCYRASQVASALNTAACAMIMLAFGRFQHMHPDLLRYIPQIMLKELEQAKPHEVSAALWGFARLGKAYAPGRRFMEALSAHMLWAIKQYGSQELVTSLWAMAVMDYRPAKKLLRAAERRLLKLVDTMNSQDVGNALWAFGHIRYKASDLLEALPAHITQRLSSFKPQEISCLLFGYTQARHYHGSLLDAAAPVIIANVSRMSAQDIVIALWAYGIFAAKPALAEPTLSDPSPSPGLAVSTSSAAHDRLLQPEISASPSRNGSAAAEGAGGAAAVAQSMRQGTEAEAETSSSSGTQTASDRMRSSQGASTSCSEAGYGDLVSTLVQAIQPRLHTMPPVGLCNLVKALASLRARSTSVHALLCDVSRLAAARTHEFRPAEMANLLYGLSHMRFDALKVCYACEVQLIRLMESGLSTSNPELLNHKILNSIVHSCISMGYTPLMLIESAEIRNIRVSGNPSFLIPRWQLGTPGFQSRPSPRRRTREPGREADAAQQPEQQQQQQQQQEWPQPEQQGPRLHRHRHATGSRRPLPQLYPTQSPSSPVHDGLAIGQLHRVGVKAQQPGTVLGEMVSQARDHQAPGRDFLLEGSSSEFLREASSVPTAPGSPLTPRFQQPSDAQAGTMYLQGQGLQVQGFAISEHRATGGAEPP